MKTTPYFERRLLQRPEIRREWCERVLQNPIATQVQVDGIIRYWGIIEEYNGRALRVVTLPDSETVITAHFDRNFSRRHQRGEV